MASPPESPRMAEAMSQRVLGGRWEPDHGPPFLSAVRTPGQGHGPGRGDSGRSEWRLGQEVRPLEYSKRTLAFIDALTTGEEGRPQGGGDCDRGTFRKASVLPRLSAMACPPGSPLLHRKR